MRTWSSLDQVCGKSEASDGGEGGAEDAGEGEGEGEGDCMMKNCLRTNVREE